MNILVYIDLQNGRPRKSSAELLTYAQKLAGEGSVTALILGQSSEDVSGLGVFGAQRILQVSTQELTHFDGLVFGHIISEAAQFTGSQVVLMSFDHSGKAVAPVVAAKLSAGLVAGATGLPQGMQFPVKAFSGKALANVNVLTEKIVVALTPNSIQAEKNGTSVAVESWTPSEIPTSKIKVLSVNKNTTDIPLPEAEKVVSGGRGLKGPENWGLIEDLARELGAATACSRPVSDIGWRPHHEHVGQTGITIRPNLYIAAGISGAIQHLAGVNSSKTIVVINTDAEAPFFKAADYGVVGDAFEVLPKLTQAIKKFKADQA
ncbi:MAG: electron transfer flavoprotein subunit alpha/FixB family protein [Bacteroidetes bacterium]|nr:electron transfer flavoprotein subunit alpha/FixB family protein [Bacteroidota bacterium]